MMKPQLYKTVVEKQPDGSFKANRIAMTDEEMAATYAQWENSEKLDAAKQDVFKYADLIRELEAKSIRPSREISLAQLKGIDPDPKSVEVLDKIEADLKAARLKLGEAKKALAALN